MSQKKLKYYWKDGEPSFVPDNAYGMLLCDYEDGKTYPVMCGHGGSMYMCGDCAFAAAKGEPQPVKPCPFHKGKGPFYTFCHWPGCEFNSDTLRAQEKSATPA